MPTNHNLSRYKEAQANGTYETALREIRNGKKTSHWMWFVFPQIKGLGHSAAADFYGLAGAAEAARYLEDEILGGRLREICQALLEQPETDAEAVFGFPDDLKLRSSMTIFDYVAPNDIFGKVLAKFYAGERDGLTLDLIRKRAKETGAI